MDWAEELKMSLKKTTARKGRRRDLLQEGASSNISSPDAAIDLTFMPQSQNSATDDITAGLAESKSPPGLPVRRISGGWADAGGALKALKSKKGSFDERFQLGKLKEATCAPPDDDDNIPIIPDLDEKDEVLLNEIADPPSVTVNRVVTLRELDSDLLTQNAFSAIEDVDLSILTRRYLQAQESLDEADSVWEWDKLFTEVIAEIHSDISSHSAQKPVGPLDEPHLIHT